MKHAFGTEDLRRKQSQTASNSPPWCEGRRHFRLLAQKHKKRLKDVTQTQN